MPSSSWARRMPRWAPSLNDLSPSPPTSNTRPMQLPTAQGRSLPRFQPRASRMALSAHSPSGNIQARLQAARMVAMSERHRHRGGKNRVLGVENEEGGGEQKVVPKVERSGWCEAVPALAVDPAEISPDQGDDRHPHRQVLQALVARQRKRIGGVKET